MHCHMGMAAPGLNCVVCCTRQVASTSTPFSRATMGNVRRGSPIFWLAPILSGSRAAHLCLWHARPMLSGPHGQAAAIGMPQISHIQKFGRAA